MVNSGVVIFVFDNSGIYQLTCPTCSKKKIYGTNRKIPSGPAFKSTYGTLGMKMGSLVSPNTYWKMDITPDP